MEQPKPIPNDNPAIVDQVIEDLKERKKVGIERYGTPLQKFNGRDALRDAYEESLDMTQYLKQAMEERDSWVDATNEFEDATNDVITHLEQKLVIYENALTQIVQQDDEDVSIKALAEDALDQVYNMDMCVKCNIHYSECDC